MKRGFGSDNHSGVHPLIMKSLEECNVAHAPSYGTDNWSLQAEKEFSKHFGPCSVFFVFNGTGANVTALKALVQSYHSVLVADVSHLNVDECAAPELLAHCKLIPVKTTDGKVSISELERHLIRRGDQHFSQVKAISLTQPTELGTCYSLQELKEISSWAHKNNLFVHIDGARLANALVELKADFKTMLSDTGVDVISMGGTKNGFMFGEAVVFLNNKLANDFKYIRKQLCQLPSKGRFIAHSFYTYLNSGLYKKIAEHSCLQAQFLKESVSSIPGVEIAYPVQSNAVFARLSPKWVKPLREKFFFYVWDENDFTCRWMCSWDTELEDIKQFTEELKKLSKESL